MIISIALMLPLALTYFQKSAGLLKFRFIHLFLDSSHVCLNNYEEGCRNHNRIWECNLHNRYLLKIYLSESVSSESFSWRRETLWHLDFMVHVFLSMEICHKHYHKIMFVINPTHTDWACSILISRLMAAWMPTIASRLLTSSPLPYQCTFHWSGCLAFMQSNWELILHSWLNLEWHRNKIMSTR